MLPRIEMPSAPPSSDAVSEIPDAAPARSGGAVPTMSSVVSVNTGASASEMRTDAATTTARPSAPPTWVSSTSPTAARERQAPIT